MFVMRWNAGESRTYTHEPTVRAVAKRLAHFGVNVEVVPVDPGKPQPKRGIYDLTGGERHTKEQVKTWAATHSPDPKAFTIIDSIYDVANAARKVVGEPVYAADVASVQCMHETSFMRYGGAASAWNPAGIKTASASGDRPQDFERPANPAEGARILINHMAAYIHGKPYGVPHGRYEVARRARLNQPAAKTVDNLAGSWAADPDYGQKLRKYLDELETGSGGKIVVPGRDQAIAKGAKGVVRLLSYGDVFYNPWAPNKDYVMYADHVPTVAEIRKQGAVCTAGPNIVLLENSLQPPKWGDWLRGGTGSYGKLLTSDKYPFDPNGWYPEYTLFVRPFTGNALIDQGHVLISLKAGKPKDVPAIQLDSFDGPGRPGLNTKRTVLRTHQLEAIAAAVPPEGWIR